MAAGSTTVRMARSGLRAASGRIGLLTRRAAGFGKIIMDGLGSAPIRGAGLLTITGGGTAPRLDGLGGPDRSLDLVTGARRWWDSSAGAATSVSVSDSPTSAGCRSLLSRFSIPGGAAVTVSTTQ